MTDRIWIPVNGPNSRLWSPAGAAAPGGSGSANDTQPVADGVTERPGAAPGAAPGPGVPDATSAPSPTVDGSVGPGSGPSDEPSVAVPGGAAGMEAALAEAEAKRDEYLDGLVRLKAEFENFRKRTRRDVEEASEHAKIALLTEFLPILDNLERALAAAEHHEEGKVLAGVRMTQGQFLDLLRKHAVEQIDPLGQPFDPAFHDAMLSQPSDQPEGTVFAVMEKGYRLGERIVRPARVAVSAGTVEEAEE